MTSPEQSDEYRQLLDISKPGAAIKFYRESENVSIKEIARQTLIPEWKLNDLENDSYEGLGADIFVIGYLRKISKLLRLDSDALVESFNKREKPQDVVEEEPSEPVLGRYAPPPKPPAKPTFSSRLAGISGVTAVAVLAVVWVLYAKFTEAPVAPESKLAQQNNEVHQALDQKTAGAVQVPQQAEEQVEGKSDEQSAIAQSVAQQPVTEIPLPTASPVAQEAVTPVPETAPVAVQNPSEPAVAARVLPSQVPTSVPTAPAAMANQSFTDRIEPAGETAAQQDLLAIAFSEDCWVQISDASGEVRIAQLKRTGDNLQLFGEAPFDVKLGNARAADVMINGQTFAFSPIPGRDTLQFTVTP